MFWPCIVHLDLKGAPWRLEYLRQIISFIKEYGGKGILIEWEDTFPYTSELIAIGSLSGCNRDGMYNLDEVKNILNFVKEFGLEAIQLVQTIGHMEFVLKHPQYAALRELAHSPAVLCPSKRDSLTLVEGIIRQVMDAQPDAKYLHIGADEAWHMNVCTDCRKKSATNQFGSASLYLDHIKAVASFIKERYPQVTVLMWDDMMRCTPVEVLNVVWNYNVKEHFKIDVQMWERYSRVFPNIWAASAFKGANGSCQMVCSAKRYASNQLAWHEEMNALQGDVKFAGIILTGWSRFDHYATLCELLPVALPSLASCLQMWTQPDGFSNESVISESLPLELWLGHSLSSALLTALDLRAQASTFVDGDQVTSWLNPWQVEHDYTSPLQAEIIASRARELLSALESSRRVLSSQLHSLTGRRSSEEIVHTWLTPVERRLRDVTDTALRRTSSQAGITPTQASGQETG